MGWTDRIFRAAWIVYLAFAAAIYLAPYALMAVYVAELS